MAGKQKRESPRKMQDLLASVRSEFLSQYMELVAAVRFLSVLPMPGRMQPLEKDETAPHLEVGSTYFPLVGLLLACLLWVLVLLLTPLVPQLVLAALVGVGIVRVAWQVTGLMACVMVDVTALGVGFWIPRRIGGLTGDNYGAIEEVVEVVALLVLVIGRA